MEGVCFDPLQMLLSILWGWPTSVGTSHENPAFLVFLNSRMTDCSYYVVLSSLCNTTCFG